MFRALALRAQRRIAQHGLFYFEALHLMLLYKTRALICRWVFLKKIPCVRTATSFAATKAALFHNDIVGQIFAEMHNFVTKDSLGDLSGLGIFH